MSDLHASARVNGLSGYVLYGLTLALLLVSGIHPKDRFTWWLEVFWVILGLVAVVVAWRFRIRFTLSLKIAMFVHAAVLIYGGWYTYELVPLGEWLKTAFGFERNHYDRIGHFVQGLFPAVLAREVLSRNRVCRTAFWEEVFVFSICMAFTGIFELIEYASALAFGSGAAAYLGSQGDIWDAQNDMAMCGLGTLVSIACWAPWHRRELRRLIPPLTS